MANDDIVSAIKQAALQAAAGVREGRDTPETRAAYAHGVRSMASLVNACLGVAERYHDMYRHDPLGSAIFDGYSKALRNILHAAEEIIPPGYEP